MCSYVHCACSEILITFLFSFLFSWHTAHENQKARAKILQYYRRQNKGLYQEEKMASHCFDPFRLFPQSLF